MNAALRDDLSVRELRPRERRHAAGLVARAFRDNPSAVPMFGEDPLRRQSGMQLLWSGFFHAVGPLSLGVLYRGMLVGVACATAPGSCTPAEPAAGGRAAAPARARREGPDLAAVQAVYAAHDPDEPHWHVGPVAVEPGLQGGGIGRLAMQRLQEHVDRAGDLAWCETDTEANVRFYTSLGWTVQGEDDAAGARVWFLQRPPAPAGTRT